MVAVAVPRGRLESAVVRLEIEFRHEVADACAMYAVSKCKGAVSVGGIRRPAKDTQSTTFARIGKRRATAFVLRQEVGIVG